MAKVELEGEFCELRHYEVLRSSRHTRFAGIFPRMRRILILLFCVMAFSATFLLVGCLGGGSQAKKAGISSTLLIVRSTLLISRALT